jgi:hypothetical protein
MTWPIWIAQWPGVIEDLKGGLSKPDIGVFKKVSKLGKSSLLDDICRIYLTKVQRYEI